MKINIVPYNNEWPLLFEKIKKEIKKSIDDNEIIIEHVGSTSVNNLASKPIIDILIGVGSNKLDMYIKPIKDLGYMHIKEYEIEAISDKWHDDFEKVRILNKACEKYQKVYKDGTFLAV